MSKTAGIVVGVIVVAGALATGGAWYTGTRLEGVLRDSIDKANAQINGSLGRDNKMSIELTSLERGTFSSVAHYSLKIHDENLSEGKKDVAFQFVDHIEHGPIPFSRLKKLNLVPVMALSRFELEKTEMTEKWYAVTKGVAPLHGDVVVGYDRAVAGNLQLTPLEIKDAGNTVNFSGLNLNFEGTAEAEKIKAVGNLDNLVLDIIGEDQPMKIEFKGMTFDTGGTKGKSGFYLGHTNVKFDNLSVEAAGTPPVVLKNFANTNLMQEEGGNLAGQINYDIGMISFNGNDIGSASMAWKFSNFDVTATQALYQLYQTKIMPQQQAAALAERPFELNLSKADQDWLNAELEKLLAGKPHVELSKLGLKTANGESHMSLAVDLADPGKLDQQESSADLGKNAISQLDAKLVLSKPMMKDLSILQAKFTLGDQLDAKTMNEQGDAAADMVAGMATALQIAKVEGDNVVSSLHYAANIVDFNGEKMPLEQFINNVTSKVGQLGGSGEAAE